MSTLRHEKNVLETYADYGGMAFEDIRRFNS